MREEILRLQNVSKSEKGIKYLDNLNLNLYKGEILGIVPINKHGLDQLIELIMQNEVMDFGRVYLDDELVNYYGKSRKQKNDVIQINQVPRLVGSLTVSDNLYLLGEKYPKQIINDNNIRKKSLKIIKDLELDIDVNMIVDELSVYERLVIELIRGLIFESKIIIINSIANFIVPDELIKFRKLVKKLTEKKISFIYIDNHHEELFQICDRVLVFENGRVLRVINKEEFIDDIIYPYIIDFEDKYDVEKIFEYNTISREGFRIYNLETENIKRLNIQIDKGKCVTLLALDNDGMDDISEIFQFKNNSYLGRFILDGKVLYIKNEESLIKNGVIYIPKNPGDRMLFNGLSISENLLFYLDRIERKNAFFEFKNKTGIFSDESFIAILKKESVIELLPEEKYKLIYYRCIIKKPKLVVIEQPFSNADMYLRANIINLINKIKERGVPILILAKSVSDTLNVSDSLTVIRKGSVISEYNN